jgi:hypothetical protein
MRDTIRLRRSCGLVMVRYKEINFCGIVLNILGDSTFYPLAALDVVSHEMAHGLTAIYSHLSMAQPYQQCAGLNEAFSDIAGVGKSHDC